MKNLKYIVFIAVTTLLVACADEELGPVLTFEKAGKGAYVALIEAQGDPFVNLFDVPGSVYTYSIEFVDEEAGATVSEYSLDLTYVDANPANGDASSGPVRFKTFSKSDFQPSVNNLAGIKNIQITATELIAAAGTTADAVKAGDQFKIVGKVTTESGAVFGAANSSSTVNGAAFRGYFDYSLTAGCPSALAGTYSLEVLETFCGDLGSASSISIVASGGGVYTFDDFSFGSYPACYGGLAASWGTLAFQDVCGEVSFIGFTDNYGDTWTFTSTIDGDKWTIEYVNTYNESGKAIITNPNGAWPFTLK